MRSFYINTGHSPHVFQSQMPYSYIVDESPCSKYGFKLDGLDHMVTYKPRDLTKEFLKVWFESEIKEKENPFI